MAIKYFQVMEELSPLPSPDFFHLDDLVIAPVAPYMGSVAATKDRRLLDELKSADHVLLQGSDTDGGIGRYFAKKPLTFLEQYADIPKIAEKYGVREELFGLYSMIHLLCDARSALSVIPVLLTLDPSEDMAKLGVLLGTVRDWSDPYLSRVGNVFEWYINWIRAYETLGPAISNSSRLSGNKLAVVSESLGNMVIAFQLGVLQKPLEWWQVVDDIAQEDPKFGRKINTIEQVLFQKTG